MRQTKRMPAALAQMTGNDWRAFTHLKAGLTQARKKGGDRILADLKALEMTPEAAALLGELAKLERGIK